MAMNSPESQPHKTGIEYPKVTTFDVVKEYWKVAKFHWILGSFALIGWFMSVLAQSIVIPIYYKEFFDLLTTADSSSVESVKLLTSIIFSVLFLNIIGWIGYRMSAISENYLLVKVGKKLVVQGFSGLINHSYSFFTNNFSGSLVQRVGRYHRSFGRLIDRLYGDIIPLVIKVIAAIIVLYYVKPTIALIVSVWILIFIAISYSLAKFKLKYDIRAALDDSKMTGTIADSISNHSSIQLFTGNKEEIRLVDSISTRLYKSITLRWNIGSIIDASQAVLTLIIEFLVFYYGIKYWQQGVISIGTFVLIQAYIISIGGSLWNFGRVIRDLYEAIADAKEMVEILHLPNEIKDISGATQLRVPQGSIEFKNVIFTFGKDKESQKPVFSGLNLSIKAGERIAIIGSSGAGKSTLIKLLLRLHDIKSGEILIDGQNIAKVTQESLRENISLVPQDPALFHRTLMDNIRYGKMDSTDEEVLEASKHAHCDIFINDFPHKYETYVGERGVKLSGGERQRVAIARALLKNAPILVLDEATSSLDSHSESLIQDALSTLMKGKTTLVIAHRLSTIRKMDRIIVLGKEGVLEDGSHDELLKSGGMYAKLWNLQAGGFSDKSIEEMLDE